MGETEARRFLHYFLFSGDDVFVPVGSLSFGERARLSLAELVASGCNLLLLDERMVAPGHDLVVVPTPRAVRSHAAPWRRKLAGC